MVGLVALVVIAATLSVSGSLSLKQLAESGNLIWAAAALAAYSGSSILFFYSVKLGDNLAWLGVTYAVCTMSGLVVFSCAFELGRVPWNVALGLLFGVCALVLVSYKPAPRADDTPELQAIELRRIPDGV